MKKLFNMFPSTAIRYFLDGVNVLFKKFGDLPVAELFRPIKPSNSKNFFICEDMVPPFNSTLHSSLSKSISHVFSVGSFGKMCWVNARRIVAGMKNPVSLLYFSVMNFPRKAMSFCSISPYADNPISIVVDSPRPKPTSIRLLDKTPKSFRPFIISNFIRAFFAMPCNAFLKIIASSAWVFEVFAGRGTFCKIFSHLKVSPLGVIPRMINVMAGLFLACILSVYGNCATTTNAGLALPQDGETGWGSTLRSNFTIIDSSFVLLSGTQTFTGSPTISSATITTLRAGRVLVATPTYTTSTDEMAVNGELRIGGSVSGGTALVCDQNFQNCSSLGGSGLLTLGSSGAGTVYVRNGGSVQASLQLLSSTVQGASSINGSNVPAVFSADRLMIGTTYGDRIGNTVDASASRSAFETPVYIGTHTVSGTPRIAVVGDTANAFSLLVSTSVTISSTNYHVGITTAGVLSANVGFQLPSKTLAQLKVFTPTGLGQSFYCSDCVSMAVCYSTGTTTPYAVASSCKTVCQ